MAEIKFTPRRVEDFVEAIKETASTLCLLAGTLGDADEETRDALCLVSRHCDRLSEELAASWK